MKKGQTANMAKLMEELDKAFNAINKYFFKGHCPDCIITVQGQGKKLKAYGWTTVQKVWYNDTENFWEINLCAEFMNRQPEEILTTLHHEMVHLANLKDKIVDVSGAGGYHNKKFKTRAEQAGLNVELHEKKTAGWAKTTPTEKTLERYRNMGIDLEQLRLARKPQTDNAKKGSKTKMKKWTCGCTTVRCAVQLIATCDKCGEPFEKEETGEDEE